MLYEVITVAVPLCADQLLAENKKGRRPLPSAWWLAIMGRLKPGWTAERATSHLQTVITSYSIHYTKLYEFGDPAIDLLIARGNDAVSGGADAHGPMKTIAGSPLKMSHKA